MVIVRATQRRRHVDRAMDSIAADGPADDSDIDPAFWQQCVEATPRVGMSQRQGCREKRRREPAGALPETLSACMPETFPDAR